MIIEKITDNELLRKSNTTVEKRYTNDSTLVSFRLLKDGIVVAKVSYMKETSCTSVVIENLIKIYAVENDIRHLVKG